MTARHHWEFMKGIKWGARVKYILRYKENIENQAGWFNDKVLGEVVWLMILTWSTDNTAEEKMCSGLDGAGSWRGFGSELGLEGWEQNGEESEETIVELLLGCKGTHLECSMAHRSRFQVARMAMDCGSLYIRQKCFNPLWPHMRPKGGAFKATKDELF